MGRSLDLYGKRFGKLIAKYPSGHDVNGNKQWRCYCDCGNKIDVVTSRLIGGAVVSCGCTRRKDIVGQKFGKLTAIEPTSQRASMGIVWKCLCDCGTICYVPRGSLISGNRKSCGCLNRSDLVGKTFGRLTVLAFDGVRNEKSYWKCRCTCGSVHSYEGAALTTGHTTSCGCKREETIKEVCTKHGLSGTRVYNIWMAMRKRCQNPNASNYCDYGAKGIKVCDEWEDPEVFCSWAMENGYDDSLSIDRVNPFGDYCPEKCEWADSVQQSRNKREYYYDAVRRSFSMALNKLVSADNRRYVTDFLKFIFTEQYWFSIFKQCNYSMRTTDDAKELYWFVDTYVSVYMSFLDWAFSIYSGITYEEYVIPYGYIFKNFDPQPNLSYEKFLEDLNSCFNQLEEKGEV